MTTADDRPLLPGWEPPEGGEGERDPEAADAAEAAEHRYLQALQAWRQDQDQAPAEAQVEAFVAAAERRFEGRFVSRRRSVWLPWAAAAPMAAAAAAALLWVLVLDGPPGPGTTDERQPSTSAGDPATTDGLAGPAAGRRGIPLAAMVEARSAADGRSADDRQSGAMTDLRVVRVERERQPAAAPAGGVAPTQRVPAQGDGVASGEWLHTGSDWALKLSAPATAELVLLPASRLRVRTFDRGTAVLELSEGAVRSRVRPRTAEQRYEVRTPYAIVSVVGTEFVTRHTPGSGTVVEGLSGTVRVETLDGHLLGLVTAGETLRVDPPQAQTPQAQTPQAQTPQAQTPQAWAPQARPAARPRRPASPALSTRLATRGVRRRRPPPAVIVTGPVSRWAPEPPTTAALQSAPRGPDPQPQPRPEPAVAQAPLPAPPAGTEGRPQPQPQPSARAPEATAEPRLPLVVRARRLLAEGRDEQARELLEGAAGKGWSAWATLGDVQRLARDHAAAERSYERALRLAPRPEPRQLLADYASLLDEAGRDPARATAAWRRYLEVAPDGAHAPAALLRTAQADLQAGQAGAARRTLELILRQHGRTQAADRALATLGRLHLRERRWDEAAALFEAHRSSARPRQAETALVGLLRVRLAQGRRAEARSLLGAYERRFPRGRRRAEVDHLRTALP